MAITISTSERAQARAWQMAAEGLLLSYFGQTAFATQSQRVYLAPSASELGVSYDVDVTADGAGVRATCTCPAGQQGRPCWHAAAALLHTYGELPARHYRPQPATRTAIAS